MALHSIELCAGVGMLGEGLRAGLDYLGVETRAVCYVEREAYAASVLAAHMQTGALDDAPIWSDLCTFDGAAWHGKVDCIVAGFPCQDLSVAGRRAGLDGKRSGLFFEVVRIATDSGAWLMWLENVAGIHSAGAAVVDETGESIIERAAARVVGELADLGWDSEWITISASDVGASHGRARWFCLAWRRADNTNSVGTQRAGRAQLGANAGRKELGHAGLQHQHLQQREDGAEHSGAGQSVAHPERAEWRPQCVASAGAIQGHDGCGREENCGAGISDTILGHANQQRTHRGWAFGQQAGLIKFAQSERAIANATRHGRHQGRAESSGQQGRPDATECIGAVANPSQPRQQRREQCGALHSDRGGQEAHGSASQLCSAHTIFAPGPSDPRWADILAAEPWRAPAISKETESVLCGTLDGLARGLDFNDRDARLRCVGNGVVALQAAAAFVQLVRRMTA